MTPDRKRTIVGYGIALDLVVIATGCAYLFPFSPTAVLLLYLGAVALGAVSGGWRAGASAAAFSLIALAITVADQLSVAHFLIFMASAALLSFGLGLLRERVLAQPQPRPERETAAVAQRQRLIPTFPRLLPWALPVLIVFIYWNLSDIISRNLGIPSLLQPIIVLLGVVVWRNRQLFQPLAIALQPVTLLVGAYTLVTFISSIWASDLRAADTRIMETTKNFLIYLLIASLAASWTSLRRALKTIAGAAAVISGVSIVQIMTGMLFNQLNGLARVKAGTLYDDSAFELRAAGPVGDPNFYGQVLVMVIPLALYLAHDAKSRLQRLGWLAAAGLVAGGVLVTYSRGAMLALAVMAGLAILALRLPVLKMGMAGLMLLIVLIAFPSNVSRRFMTSFQGLIPDREQSYKAPDSSIEMRKLVMGSALLMFADRPLTGLGAGNFNENFPQYSDRYGSSAKLYGALGSEQHAHSLYLEIGAEQGLLGLTLFLAAFAAAFAAVRKTWTRLNATGQQSAAMMALGLGIALSGYAVTSIFLHGGTQRYLWLLFAFVAATVRAADAAPGQGAPEVAA